MFLSELQHKDVISTKDGRVIGHIIDAEINNEGMIMYLIIEQKRNFKKFMIGSSDSKVSFKDIAKIGEDVILVNI